MNLRELDEFNLDDAVHFHDILNPSLFEKDSDMLRPAVRKRLLTIAEDFIDHLGVKVKVEDITLSGSNAAYSYTKHSDIDLHVMVDMSKLPDNDVYKELFHAKKTIYNDTHDITIFGYEVELYVQDSNEPVVSLGEYSVKNDKWIKLPRKRRANFDQNSSQQKYNKLGHLIERALQTKDIEKLEILIQKLKKYRKAGLDKHGEFGPENLAYKALRTQGVIQKIFDTIDELHSNQLSIPESKLEIKPNMLKSQLAKEYKVSREHIRPLGEALKVTPVKPVTQAIKTQIQPKQQVYSPELKKPTPAAIIHIKNKNLPTDEDYHPNEKPPGPEFRPTMPAGTVRVDVSDVYDWYKLGMHISDLEGLGKHDFGKGPPSTIFSFGSEPEEHKYIKNLEKTGLTTTDIDPKDPNQPKGMKRQKVDPTYNVNETFNKPYPIKWEKSEHGDYDALATLDDGTFLSIMFNNEYKNTWMVEFYRNNSQEVTGEGDAQRVFATVLTAISQFIKKKKPVSLFFSAVKENDPKGSRARLYNTLVNRYATKLGYSVNTRNDDRGMSFKLTKVKQDVAEEAFNGIDVAMEVEDDEIFVKATAGGKELGHVLFVIDGDYLMPQDLEVEERFRGQGIAQTMYDYVKSRGYKIRRSGQQTDAGRGFWTKHRPKQNVWEQGVAEGSIKDLHYDLQDQQWDAIVGYVINGLKKNMDIGRIELNLYKYAGQELFDVDQALEDRGFRNIKDLADHIRQHNGRYVPPTYFDLSNLGKGVAEGLDEAVGDNYLYHATQPAGMMRILRTGIIKASYRPQQATKARTQYPTVSTTRSKQYAESNEFVDFLNLPPEGNAVIMIFDRNSVANHYKMFSTSQGTQTVGDEFEEVIVVPKGTMPIKGTLKGFYFNPKRTTEIQEFKDYPWFKELLNSPYYMGQKQDVAEVSGYIPSKKEKNDPRFKTALTVDVHPDSIKKNAKAFGFKISRAGIPPLLRK